jgi:hypothetical protein
MMYLFYLLVCVSSLFNLLSSVPKGRIGIMQRNTILQKVKALVDHNSDAGEWISLASQVLEKYHEVKYVSCILLLQYLVLMAL